MKRVANVATQTVMSVVFLCDLKAIKTAADEML